MDRRLTTLFLLPWLVACGHAPWHRHASADWTDAALTTVRSGVQYDFAWRLSGSRQVAPLQVFDDGRQTWLQFLPGQAVPAIFGVTAAGTEHPVPYRRHEPYVVVQGKWQTLLLRGGHLQARADYLRGAAQLAPAALAANSPTKDVTAHLASQHSGGQVSPPLSAPIMTDKAAQAASHQHDKLPQNKPYRVSQHDENMRRVLVSWAKIAGWTFDPEHWAVDVDIPLSGSANFEGDFKQAVRELLAATELGELPVQPCFYTNRVLRVVSIAQACDRSAVRPGAAS